MTLSQWRTLQNVIQTQTFEPCQLNKLSTLHARLPLQAISTRSTCLEHGHSSTVTFLTTTNELNIQTQNNVFLVIRMFLSRHTSLLTGQPITRCSSIFAGFYHVFHGVEQHKEAMLGWISEDDRSTSTWIVRWTVDRIDHTSSNSSGEYLHICFCHTHRTKLLFQLVYSYLLEHT